MGRFIHHVPINDLRADTAELKNYIYYMSYAAQNVDTLFKLMTFAEPGQIPSGKLYWYGLWGGAPRVFIPNDANRSNKIHKESS